MLRPVSIARGAAALLCAATASVAGAGDAPPAVETTVLARLQVDPEGFDETSVVVAPRSAHVAWRTHGEDGWRWVVDGTPGTASDDPTTLVFSDDGARFAWFARRKSEWTLVVDGKGERVEAVQIVAPRSLRFSPDGKRLAFSGTRVAEGRSTGQVVVLDGVAGPPFRGVDPETIVFSGDGRRIAYVANDGNVSFVVVDGRPGAGFPHGTLGTPAFSGDGKHVAAPVQLAGSRFMVFDDVEGAKFDRLGPPSFAPAGARWAYVGARAGKSIVVLDGVEGKAYDEVAAPVWSDDGSRVAWVAKTGATFRVVVDGKEGPPYAWVGGRSVGFSPDGKRLAYWASAGQGKKPFYVVDGVERKEADLVSDSSGAAFSPDGKRVAYAVQRAGKWVVRTDEVDGPEFDAIGVGFPVFSPAGDVVYQAMAAGRWHLVRETERGPAFGGFVEGTLGFGADGVTVACVARQGAAVHVVIDGAPGDGWQAILPGSQLTADGPRSFHAWFLKDDVPVHARTSRAGVLTRSR